MPFDVVCALTRLIPIRAIPEMSVAAVKAEINFFDIRCLLHG